MKQNKYLITADELAGMGFPLRPGMSHLSGLSAVSIRKLLETYWLAIPEWCDSDGNLLPQYSSEIDRDVTYDIAQIVQDISANITFTYDEPDFTWYLNYINSVDEVTQETIQSEMEKLYHQMGFQVNTHSQIGKSSDRPFYISVDSIDIDWVSQSSIAKLKRTFLGEGMVYGDDGKLDAMAVLLTMLPFISKFKMVVSLRKRVDNIPLKSATRTWTVLDIEDDVARGKAQREYVRAYHRVINIKDSDNVSLADFDDLTNSKVKITPGYQSNPIYFSHNANVMSIDTIDPSNLGFTEHRRYLHLMFRMTRSPRFKLGPIDTTKVWECETEPGMIPEKATELINVLSPANRDMKPINKLSDTSDKSTAFELSDLKENVIDGVRYWSLIADFTGRVIPKSVPGNDINNRFHRIVNTCSPRYSVGLTLGVVYNTARNYNQDSSYVYKPTHDEAKNRYSTFAIVGNQDMYYYNPAFRVVGEPENQSDQARVKLYVESYLFGSGKECLYAPLMDDSDFASKGHDYDYSHFGLVKKGVAHTNMLTWSDHTDSFNNVEIPELKAHSATEGTSGLVPFVHHITYQDLDYSPASHTSGIVNKSWKARPSIVIDGEGTGRPIVGVSIQAVPQVKLIRLEPTVVPTVSVYAYDDRSIEYKPNDGKLKPIPNDNKGYQEKVIKFEIVSNVNIDLGSLNLHKASELTKLQPDPILTEIGRETRGSEYVLKVSVTLPETKWIPGPGYDLDHSQHVQLVLTDSRFGSGSLVLVDMYREGWLKAKVSDNEKYNQYILTNPASAKYSPSEPPLYPKGSIDTLSLPQMYTIETNIVHKSGMSSGAGDLPSRVKLLPLVDFRHSVHKNNTAVSHMLNNLGNSYIIDNGCSLNHVDGSNYILDVNLEIQRQVPVPNEVTSTVLLLDKSLFYTSGYPNFYDAEPANKGLTNSRVLASVQGKITPALKWTVIADGYFWLSDPNKVEVASSGGSVRFGVVLVAVSMEGSGKYEGNHGNEYTEWVVENGGIKIEVYREDNGEVVYTKPVTTGMVYDGDKVDLYFPANNSGSSRTYRVRFVSDETKVIIAQESKDKYQSHDQYKVTQGSETPIDLMQSKLYDTNFITFTDSEKIFSYKGGKLRIAVWLEPELTSDERFYTLYENTIGRRAQGNLFFPTEIVEIDIPPNDSTDRRTLDLNLSFPELEGRSGYNPDDLNSELANIVQEGKPEYRRDAVSQNIVFTVVSNGKLFNVGQQTGNVVRLPNNVLVKVTGRWIDQYGENHNFGYGEYLRVYASIEGPENRNYTTVLETDSNGISITPLTRGRYKLLTNVAGSKFPTSVYTYYFDLR